MAGVWKLWKNPKTEQREKTFAILTGGPNELMAPIHDHMTMFLESRDYEEYLAPSERPPVHLLRIPVRGEDASTIDERRSDYESAG